MLPTLTAIRDTTLSVSPFGPCRPFVWEPLWGGLITSQLVLITPEIARQMLSTSLGNVRRGHIEDVTKRESSERIDQYGRDMLEGRWVSEYPHGPAFNKRGELFEGHTRLRAIVKYNVTIEMLVTFNADNEANIYIDQGAKRDRTDVVRTLGVKDADKNELATLRRFLEGESTKVYISSDPRAEVQAWAKYGHVIKWSHVQMRSQKGSKGLATAGTRGAIARAYYHLPTTLLEEFARTFRDPAFVKYEKPDEDPAYRLRKKLIELSSGASSVNSNAQWYQYQLTEIAIDRYSRGEPLKQFRNGQWAGELFPLVD